MRGNYNVWTRCLDSPKSYWHILHNAIDKAEADKIELVGNRNAIRFGINVQYIVLPVGKHP